MIDDIKQIRNRPPTQTQEKVKWLTICYIAEDDVLKQKLMRQRHVIHLHKFLAHAWIYNLHKKLIARALLKNIIIF